MEKLVANGKSYETLAAYFCGGRLPHALLIEGPTGCGKATFARETAQGALCTAERVLRPCGVCRDCVKVERGIHPDVLTFGGEGGSRSFHIDVVRTLRQQAFVRPNEAEAKVLILQDVQEMSVQAQNALLKIIEEPPKNVYFLLTCENKAALLDTILSRVTVVELNVPSVQQCIGVLTMLQPEADPERLATMASRANGNLGKALALLEGDEAADGVNDKAAQILYNACIGSELEALSALGAYERNRQGLTALLDSMSATLSELMLRGSADQQLETLANRAGRLRLMKILAIIEDTAAAVAQNANGLLLITALCARIRAVLAEG